MRGAIRITIAKWKLPLAKWKITLDTWKITCAHVMDNISHSMTTLYYRLGLDLRHDSFIFISLGWMIYSCFTIGFNDSTRSRPQMNSRLSLDDCWKYVSSWHGCSQILIDLLKEWRHPLSTHATLFVPDQVFPSPCFETVVTSTPVGNPNVPTR